MFFDAAGSMLPAAAAIALSPFPVIGIVLVLVSPNGRTKGVAFTAAWLASLSLLTAGLLLALEGIQDSEGSRTAVDWARVVVGSALLTAAGWKWRTRPRGGARGELPAWMSRIDGLSVGGAASLGSLLGVNPKNVVLTLAACSSIAELVDDGANEVAAAALFVALSSITVVGATALQVFAANRAGAALAAVRDFMVGHASAITVVVLVALGGMILADGIAGLAA